MKNPAWYPLFGIEVLPATIWALGAVERMEEGADAAWQAIEEARERKEKSE